MAANTNLTTLDIAVLAVTLAVSASIGIFYRFSGGRQKTAKEYLMADGNMSVMPVAFSLMASFMSAVTLLGVPKENYFYGTEFFVINFSYAVGTPVAAYVFLPVFFRLKVVSAYEYLEKRFGKATRLFASAIFIVQMMFYMSVVVYAPATTLHAVTHLSKWSAILSVGVVCTFYCTIGGMKAVLWTDVFQSFLMFGSMLAVLIVGSLRIGGFSQVWREVYDGGRLEFDNFSLNPEERHTFWSLVIGTFFMYLSIYGVNQAQVQRLLTIKELRKAQRALMIQWPILTALSFTTCLTGLVIYANFRGCDPYVTGKIANSDQILPFFVMEHLSSYAGLPGLFVAGIFSGALSTVSSAINSLAAVTYEDFIKPTRCSNVYETVIMKVIAFIYGVICVLLTGVADRLGGVLQASFVFFGVGGGPLLGVFCLGMLSRRCSQKAALAGLIAGLSMGIYIGLGAMSNASPAQMLPLDNSRCPEQLIVRNTTVFNSNSCTAYFPMCNISYTWYTFAAWLPTVIVGIIASLIWPANDVSEKFLSPVIASRSQPSLPNDRNSSDLPLYGLDEPAMKTTHI